MAVNKNFVFRENWVGSKVAGMKTTFFAIFGGGDWGLRTWNLQGGVLTILIMWNFQEEGSINRLD